MKSPQPIDPTLIGVAIALARVEEKVDSVKEDLKPLQEMVQGHEEDINLGKGALAAMGALWTMTVAGVGILIAFLRKA